MGDDWDGVWPDDQTAPDIPQPAREMTTVPLDRFVGILSKHAGVLGDIRTLLGELRAGQLAVGDVLKPALGSAANERLAILQALALLTSEMTALSAVASRRDAAELRKMDADARVAEVQATAAATSSTAAGKAQLVRVERSEARRDYLTYETWVTLKPWILRLLAAAALILSGKYL